MCLFVVGLAVPHIFAFILSVKQSKKPEDEKFYISLTVHLGIILVNNELDALFSMYLFISLLCMF